MGTGVQLRNRAGDVLFAWSPFDHLEIDVTILDSQDLNSNPINWTHGNSIDLDSDGNLLLSFRNLSQVIKVDSHTGGVMWRMGGDGNQFSFENLSPPAFTRQHGVRSVGNGQIELLDNLGEKKGSRAERYALDPANRTARLVGTYASSAFLIAQIGGSTQALAGGNVLVSFGNGGGVEEYDSFGNVVWRLEGNPGYVFRAQRIRSLYQPGFNDPR